MDRINRYLGGDRALLIHLIPRLRRQDQQPVLVDLGAGSGLFLRRLANWADHDCLELSLIGLDWSARNLTASPGSQASSHPVQLVQADAANLPLGNNTVDFVISSLFMHHFAPGPLRQVLRAAYHVSSRGIIMSDLIRGWAPLTAFRLIKPFLARNPLTRHDGALSIRRAYLPGELLEIARQAGLSGAQVCTHAPWRMTLVVDK